MENEPLLVWVMEYYDTVAGEKSLDLYKTEEMAIARLEMEEEYGNA
jgi:hypothetical protein